MALENGYEPVEGSDNLFEDGDENLDKPTDSPIPQDISMPDAGGDELANLLKEAGAGENFNINDLNDNELVIDQRDKAEDAQDFADIGSDDDLPDEPTPQDTALPELPSESAPMLDGINTNSLQDDLDELFGDYGGPSSPTDMSRAALIGDVLERQKDEDDVEPASEHDEASPQTFDHFQPELDEVEDRQWRIQQALFAQSGKGSAPQTAEENIEQWLKLEYPGFRPDETPFFSRLFPPKLLRWNGKAPLRPPKPIQPSKVNLELEQDHKGFFNSAAPPQTKSWPLESGVIVVDAPTQATAEDDSTDESDRDEEFAGGITMQELAYLCADFDTLSSLTDFESDIGETENPTRSQDVDMFEDDLFLESKRPVKKHRTGPSPREIVSVYHYDMPSFDEPERATQKIAQKVVLDLNDPALLLEEVDTEAVQARGRAGNAKGAAKSVKEMLSARFGTSNDAEYDLLKQNHQHKVRGQLGHLSIDHSIPAVRLQYPYYKVRMSINEARLFHRKKLHFRHLVFSFNKTNKLKRKNMKGKPIKEIYQATKDLSMGDNSIGVLLEYSEEYPMMLSQTGMGNKIVNYYRRKAKDDTSRPKKDIGETSVLLPEDKSPFYMFGHVDPGETVSALYNSMYRAPIYEHQNRPQNFLIIREDTGLHSSQFFLRGIDHLFVVGQELPSVTIPGPHSRFVTTAAKNRLKAISFRIARRKKSHRIRVEDVTRHFPLTTDMQNRQKMKEFMVFSKEHKEWEMKPGETVPDEEHIQNLIRPEDICLLDSMQVGQQYLHDAGFAEDDDDDDDDDGKEKKGLSIEQELAPWKTTKNFMHATQGKAMLTLYGDGDPSGRGEAFSFIKTSMKGGFKAQGAPAQELIDQTQKKPLGGHSYNVASQQKAYDDAIRMIWDKQKHTLEHEAEIEDDDLDEGVDGQDDSFVAPSNVRNTPRSATNTPAPFRRHDDETGTSFSKHSTASQNQRYLRIRRRVKVKGEFEIQEHIETNPAVIKQYMRLKNKREAASFR